MDVTKKNQNLPPNFAYVEGGSFRMGSDLEEAYNWEKPVHKVTLERSFAIGKYAITFEEYDAYAKATGRDLPSDEGWGRGKRSVINVNWDDAVAYAEWLSAKEGKIYRLPTEAEWEYAARGGQKSKGYIYAGSDDINAVAWCDERQANELELYDMSGNVWEWCSDWFDDNYYANSPEHNPEGPSLGSGRVQRGGDWECSARDCRSTSRSFYGPGNSYFTFGFRLVLQFK